LPHQTQIHADKLGKFLYFQVFHNFYIITDIHNCSKFPFLLTH